MTVAIIVPMLGRAHRVEPLLTSIAAATDSYRVLFACTPTDTDVLTAVTACGADAITVARQRRGDYARKIQAGIDATTEPFIFTAADDLHFHPGWLDAALAKMTGPVRVVGTNDLCNPRVMAGEHSTHFLVDRRYVAEGTIDRPGVLMHHGYLHEYVDDELVCTAKARGVWAFAVDSIVEHLHPMAGKAPMDRQYQQQRARMMASRHEFRRRQRLWMQIPEQGKRLGLPR